MSHPTCDVPFPPRRTRESGDRFGIPKPRESGSVIGADRRRFGPSSECPAPPPGRLRPQLRHQRHVSSSSLGPHPGVLFSSCSRAGRRACACVSPKGVPQGQTECGGIVLAAIYWAPSAQRRCHPEEAFFLPTFSNLVIVNKLFSLSLSLSLSLSETPESRDGTQTTFVRWA